MKYDAVIIGGGAAGLFCAAQAGKRDKRVVVIEHNAEVGRKIIISGGGRCNFTNIHTSPENFVSENPHFCKSALVQYTPTDFLGLVRKHKIDFYEKKLGQLFCRERSHQIVEMLLKECSGGKAEIRTGCSVISVRRSGSFFVSTNQGEFEAEKLIIACGGLSFPKIGATGLGYQVARKFDIKITPTRPSLVAMKVENENFRSLAGVSVDSTVRLGKAEFRENILFTHRGLSGPAILQISNYWHRDRPVIIDLVPDFWQFTGGQGSHGRKSLAGYLSTLLPQRFVTYIAAELPKKKVEDISRKEWADIQGRLKNWQIHFSATEGYDRAEVTLGGVSTDELSSKTMESRKVPGLYFIGEVVDVTGWLGGYNFQWAWSSAYAAASSI